ncbi:MAG: organomercurial lyase [Candidatus Nanopelagicales bacterium]
MDLTDVRLAIYRWFAFRGEAPTLRDLLAVVGGEAAAIEAALRQLHDAHLIVTDSSGAIVMAHPWAARDLGFVVASSEQKWWGGCAWDSLSIAAVLGVDVLLATRCPYCGRSLSLWVDHRHGPRGDDLVAHLLVPVAQMWNDVVYTCSQQRFFCSREHVTGWLRRSKLRRGAVLDLDALWRLASTWYAGRMTSEYRRRTPAEAAAYFTELGLRGEFWRVPGASASGTATGSGQR